MQLINNATNFAFAMIVKTNPMRTKADLKKKDEYKDLPGSIAATQNSLKNNKFWLKKSRYR
jgi:hypothetical protein